MTPLSSADQAALARILSPGQRAEFEQSSGAPETLAATCQTVEQYLNALLPFVPTPVVVARLSQPQPDVLGSRYSSGTMLVVDLAQYADLAPRYQARGRAGAESFSLLISQLLRLIYNELQSRGGSVVSLSGDAVTVLFESTVVGTSHAAQACAAALSIQRRLPEVLAEFSKTTGAATLLLPRIGIHSGPTLIAEVGDHEHRTLLTTGHTTQRVALAVDQALAGEIIVSAATRQALVQAQVEPRSKDLYCLKNLIVQPSQPLVYQRRWRPGQPSIQALNDTLARVRALAPFVPPAVLPGANQAAWSGEFRPVTALIANFYGFGKLLEFLEPLAVLYNDTALVGEIMRTYYRHLQPVVHAHGGTIAAVNVASVGEKFVVLFGGPTVHDDDSVRAIQTSLALPGAIHNINRDVLGLVREWVQQHQEQRALLRIANIALRFRVGLSTGQALTGIFGPLDRHAYLTIGEPLQQATQLMQVARDGDVLLPAALRNPVRHLVETQPLPPTLLPGTAQPTTLYRAMQVHTATAVDVLPSSAPFIGRITETTRIARITEQALTPGRGAGHVLAIVGNAGSGKSRLVEEVLHTIRTTLQDSEIAEDTCQSYEQTTPYAIIARLLRSELELILTGALTEQQQALGEYLDDLVPEWSRFSPLLGPLLNLPLPETALTEGLTAEQRRARLHDLVAEMFLALARRQPFVLVLDDLHWADPSTQELAQRIASGLRGVPLLLILPYRPEPPIPEPWRDLGWTTRLDVAALGGDDSAELLGALLQGEPPPELRPLLVNVQGTPFFLEETVRYVLDSGLLARTDDGAWGLTQPAATITLPATVQELISARLARLDDKSTLAAPGGVGDRPALYRRRGSGDRPG